MLLLNYLLWRPDKHEKHYTNCRWASKTDQARNTRQNHWIEFNGKRLILTDWAGLLGISVSTLLERISTHGVEKALTMNRRSARNITAFGESLTVRQWSERIGVSPSVLKQRLVNHKPEIALTMKKRAKKK